MRNDVRSWRHSIPHLQSLLLRIPHLPQAIVAVERERVVEDGEAEALPVLHLHQLLP
jgi:hypothetical protein